MLFNRVSRPLRLDFFQKALIDLKENLQVPGHHLLEESHAPLHEGFGQQRVIGVGKGAPHNRPCLVPRHPVFIVQDALKLEHRDRRVRIVELDRPLFREMLQVLVRPAKAADDVFERTGDEKVLLQEAKLFALSVLSFG